MNYKIDDRIEKKYTKGFERTLPIKYLVLHGTGGGTSSRGLLKWMLDPGETQEKRYKRGVALFHYLIDRSGQVTQIINPERWVYHASIGRMDGGTIGIELMNPSRTNKKAYEPGQYASLVLLLDELLDRYPSIEKIISHRYAKMMLGGGKFKSCPGNLDWDILASSLAFKGADLIEAGRIDING